ncbi:MAG: ATP-binding protein [Thermoleophilia bacterium]
MRRTRLFWRIYATYLVVAILGVLAMGGLALGTARDFYLDRTADGLQARAALVLEEVRPLLDEKSRGMLQATIVRLGAASQTRYTVIAGESSGEDPGTVLAESAADPSTLTSHADRPEFKQALRSEIGQSVRFSSTLKKDEMYVAVPLEQDGEVVAVVRAAMPLASINDALPQLSWRIAVGATAVAALTALIGLLVSRSISHQMERLRDGAVRFAAGDLEHKLAVPRTAEFAAVAESLNSMAERIADEIQTLTRERNEREAVLASMVEAVIAVDVEERVITANNAATRLLGREGSSVVGHSIQEVVRNAELQRVVQETLAGNAPVEREITLWTDRIPTTLQANGTRLHSPDGGQSVGAVVVLNDVTRLKRLESVRSDFVANVSHELRTPLTAIKGFAETLLEGAADDPQTRDTFLRIIAGQAERLNSITADLLALSELEADVLRPGPFGDVDLQTVMASAVELCSVAANAKTIKLSLHASGPVVVPGNAPLIEQALVNLIDNAIKYSPSDTAVTISALQSTDEVTVEVTDQGPGIAREHQPRLFERFYRVDRARSRDLGGTGLGLAIVKHVAQAHSGRVSLRSELGSGSTFCLHLPRHASQPPRHKR